MSVSLKLKPQPCCGCFLGTHPSHSGCPCQCHTGVATKGHQYWNGTTWVNPATDNALSKADHSLKATERLDCRYICPMCGEGCGHAWELARFQAEMRGELKAFLNFYANLDIDPPEQPHWMSEVVSRLRYLQQHIYNPDANEPIPNIEALSRVLPELNRFMHAQAPAPYSVVASAYGNIVLDWHKGGSQLQIEVRTEGNKFGTFAWISRSNRGTQYGPLNELITEVRLMIDEIASGPRTEPRTE